MSFGSFQFNSNSGGGFGGGGGNSFGSGGGGGAFGSSGFGSSGGFGGQSSGGFGNSQSGFGSSTSGFGGGSSFQTGGSGGGFGSSGGGFGGGSTFGSSGSSFGSSGSSFGSSGSSFGGGGGGGSFGSSGGGFGSSGGFQNQTQNQIGTKHASSMQPFEERDKKGKVFVYQSLPALPAFQGKSFEELRFEDQFNQPAAPVPAQSSGSFASSSSFGSSSAGMSSGNSFGTSTSSFGGGSTGGFGSSGGGFGSTGSSFGSSGGFGSSAGGFGSKPSGFGASPGFGSSAGGFGSASSGGGFGTSSSGFGSTGSGFGSNTPAFGSSGSGFGGSGGFGASKSGFGSNTSGFGASSSAGFGTATSGFGSGGFGSGSGSGFGSGGNTGFGSSSASSGFGFGSSTSSAGFGTSNNTFGSSGSGFGSTQSGFGAGAAKPGGFGGFGNTGGNSAAGGFGAKTGGFGASGGFGSNNKSGFGFGSGGTQSSGGGFGSGFNSSGGFGASSGGFGSNQKTGFGAGNSGGFGNTGNSGTGGFNFGGGGFGASTSGQSGFGSGFNFGNSNNNSGNQNGNNTNAGVPQFTQNLSTQQILFAKHDQNPYQIDLSIGLAKFQEVVNTPIKKPADQPSKRPPPKMVSSTPSSVIRLPLSSSRVRSNSSMARSANSTMMAPNRSVVGGGSQMASIPASPMRTTRIFPESSSNLSGLPVPSSVSGSPVSMLFNEQKPRGYQQHEIRTLHNPQAPTIPILTPNRTYRRPRDSPSLSEKLSGRNPENGKENLSAELAAAADKKEEPRVPTLTGEGYYTEPPMEQLKQMSDEHLGCVVNFVVGHKDWGRVSWPGKTDIRGLNLDELVRFGRKQVEVYAPDIDKPSVGEGLNKRANIELFECWPKVPKHHRNDPTYDVTRDDEELNRHSQKLMRKCEMTDDVRFEAYDRTHGIWKFEVEHFTIYGDDSDDEDENVDPRLSGTPLTRPVFSTLESSVRLKKFGSKKSKDEMKETSQSIPPLRARRQSNLSSLLDESTTTSENSVEMDDRLESLGEYPDDFDESPLFSDRDISPPFDESEPSFVDRNYHRLEAQASPLDHIGLNAMKNRDISTSFSGFMSLGTDATHHQGSWMADDDRSMDEAELFPPVSSSVPQNTVIFPDDPTDIIARGCLSGAVVTDFQPFDSISAMARHEMEEDTKSMLEEVKYQLVSEKVRRGCDPEELDNQWDVFHRHDFGTSHRHAFRTCFGQQGKLFGVFNRALLTSQRVISGLEETFGIDLYTELVANLLNIHKVFHYDDADAYHRNSPLRRLAELSSQYAQCSETFLEFFKVSQNKSIEDLERGASILEEWIRVWKLIHVLWGPQHGGGREGLGVGEARSGSYAEDYARREGLSEFISQSIAKQIDDELLKCDAKQNEIEDVGARKVFLLLCGNRLEEACAVAISHGDFRLATLIPQSYGQRGARSQYNPAQDIANQIKKWQDGNNRQGCVWDSFSLNRQLVYKVLSGDVSVCEGMDWLQCLGIIMWYCLPQNTSLDHVLKFYESLLHQNQSQNQNGMDVDGFDSQTRVHVVDPSLVLPHVHEFYAPANREDAPIDLVFTLLRFKNDPSVDKRTLFDVTNHQPSLNEFLVAWLVYDLFHENEVLKSHAITGKVYCSFVEQLERLGLWQWSVYVAFYSRKYRHIAVESDGVKFEFEGLCQRILERSVHKELPCARLLGRNARLRDMRRDIEVLDENVGLCEFFDYFLKKLDALDNGRVAPMWAELLEYITVCRHVIRSPEYIPCNAIVKRVLEFYFKSTKNNERIRDDALNDLALSALQGQRNDADVLTLPFISAMNMLVSAEIPFQWIEMGRAFHAESCHDYQKAVDHFIAAGSFDKAHDVFCRRVLPRYILSDQLEISLQVLGTLEAHNNVEGWSRLGSVYLQYVRLLNDIKVSQHNFVQALHGRNLRNILTGIGTLRAQTMEETVCRGEMDKRVRSLERQLRHHSA